jgi:hypothetical protein
MIYIHQFIQAKTWPNVRQVSDLLDIVLLNDPYWVDLDHYPQKFLQIQQSH